MASAERGEADVCVVGGGPAGATFAIRLAQLGHQVCLLERARFPRRHLGESLSPGVAPLLDSIGAGDIVASGRSQRVPVVRVDWEQGPVERRDPRAEGLLVDRGKFDQRLLDRARSAGVRVLQPASLRRRELAADGWRLEVLSAGRAIELRAGFLADAAGRAAALPARRRRTGCRTFAIYGYWRGAGLPDEPRIEALSDAWAWSVPIPDGTSNTLVFVDASHLRTGRRHGLETRLRELLARSGVMGGCGSAELAGPVGVADATPYLDEDPVAPRWIKVGDAALALDPLSSTGVQKAIQTALAGALVVNTLTRKPGRTKPALGYYRQSLADASARHRSWASAHYGLVAAVRGDAFWATRAAQASPRRKPAPPRPVDERAMVETRLALSPDLEIVSTPCLGAEFVEVRPALRHPSLDGPVAFVQGHQLAPLLGQLRPGMTPIQLARAWADRLPVETGIGIASWLLSCGILVDEAAGRRAPLAIR